MAILKKLELSTHTQKKAKEDPVIRSRNKFIAALQQQINIVESELKGETYTVERLRWRTNAEGIRERVPTQIAPRPWYWTEEDGSVYLQPKIGLRPLELEKGKPTIKIAAKSEIAITLNILIEAAETGELDQQIAEVRNTRK